jgi:hypothetical protein
MWKDNTMPDDANTTAVSFSQAIGAALIALAIKSGADNADRKTRLTMLYEAQAISGDDLAWAIRQYGLEAA